MLFGLGVLALFVAAWFVLGWVMSGRWSRLLCLAALAGLLILIPRPTPVSESMAASPEDDLGPALDLSGKLVDLDGNEFSLADHKPKVLFLNFWATWCGPCRAEMPSMARLHEQLEEEGLSIIAITDEPASLVRRYLSQHPYPFRVLIDPEGGLTRRLGVIGLPTTLILDKKRRLIYSHVGAAEWDKPAVIDLFREALQE